MESASNRPIKSNGNRPASAGYRIRLIDLYWKSIENNFVGYSYEAIRNIFQRDAAADRYRHDHACRFERLLRA